MIPSKQPQLSVKQRARDIFEKRFGHSSYDHIMGNVNSFIDEIIDIAVAEERERVWKEKPLVI